jgi:hypothetical protein
MEKWGKEAESGTNLVHSELEITKTNDDCCKGEITCKISKIEADFMCLTLIQLKEILKLKAESYSLMEKQKVYELMLSAAGIEEMREIYQHYVQDYEMETLITATAECEDLSTQQLQQPTNPLPCSSPEFHHELETLPTSVVKKLLSVFSERLPTPSGRSLVQREIATACERSELVALCKRWISSEEEYHRICDSLESSSLSTTPASTPATNTALPMVPENLKDEDNDAMVADDESCSSKDSEESIRHQRSDRQTSFRPVLAAIGLDDGSCLRGMLEKKTRRSLFSSWHERFWILNYSLLTLRYYNISR